MSQLPNPKDAEPPDRVRKENSVLKKPYEVNRTSNSSAKALKAMITRFEASDTNKKNRGLAGYISPNISRSTNSMDLSSSQVEDIKSSLRMSAKSLNKTAESKQKIKEANRLKTKEEEKRLS